MFKKLLPFLSFTLILAACSSGVVAVDEIEPVEVRTDFILFQESDSNSDTEVGALYIQTGENEPIKIGENVRKDAHFYDNSTGQLLYIDADNTLYLYDEPDAPKELAQQVSSADTDYLVDDLIPYFDLNGHLHILHEEKSTMVGANVKDYSIDKNMVYINEPNGNFYQFNLEDEVLTAISGDADAFSLVGNEGQIVYNTYNNELYFYSEDNEQPSLISSNFAPFDAVHLLGDQLYYLEAGNEASTPSLYRTNISKEKEPELIAQNITAYNFSPSNLYYLTSDNQMYEADYSNEDSELLAENVSSFNLLKEGIVYEDNLGDFHRMTFEVETQEKIAHSATNSHITPNANVYSFTDDYELFINEENLASDINEISLFHEYVAYVEKDTLYLVQDGEKMLEIPLSNGDYSTIFFQNQLVYESILTEQKVIGVWALTGEGDHTTFMEIDENLDVHYYNVPDNILPQALEFVEATEETLLFKDLYDNAWLFDFSSSQPFILMDYIHHVDIQPTTMEKAEAFMEELDRKYLKEMREMEEAARQREKESGDGNFIDYWPGETSTVETFIEAQEVLYEEASIGYYDVYFDPNSELYQTMVENLNAGKYPLDRQILDYNIESIVVNLDGSAEVTVKEEHLKVVGDKEIRQETIVIYHLLKENDYSGYIISSIE